MRSTHKYLLSFMFFCFFLIIGYCQKTAPLIQDCFNAAIIDAEGEFTFKESPQGIGEELEFSGNPSNSLQYFKKEHNSAWFQFDPVYSGILIFKIIPKDTAADFDFLLFKYTDENFCSDIVKKKIKPLRTNISRYNPEENSVTGLSLGADEERVHSGPGSHLSKAIDVEQGDRYCLVLDNVYGNKAGFSLVFDYYKTVEIIGVIKNDENNLINEEVKVLWESKTGELLAQTIADKTTGEFKLDAPVLKTSSPGDYTLSVESNNHFFFEKMIKITSATFPDPINVILPELKKGKNIVLNNINFFGGSPSALPASIPTFKRILKLMKRNKSLRIRIDGHTNGCPGGTAVSQDLSLARALTVKSFLIKKGIDAERITVKGFNCTQMLFPSTGTEEEQSLNRRVEILVTGY
ncbi:OmpA family protein [Flavobacteriales bacterium]|nr:OmpA family protein [Flavobacteriales bacterium]